jgi:hypothetical protein
MNAALRTQLLLILPVLVVLGLVLLTSTVALIAALRLWLLRRSIRRLK